MRPDDALSDEQHYHGQWTIPGIFEDPTAGVLQCGEPIVLTLYTPRIEEQALSRLLFGHVPNEVSGYSQDRAFRMTGVQVDAVDPAGRIQLAIQTVYSTQHAAPEEIPDLFDRYVFVVGFLDEWMNRTAVESLATGPGRSSGVAFNRLPSISFTVPGATIEVAGETRAAEGRRFAQLEYAEAIGVKLASPMSLDNVVYRYLRPFQYFLAVAAGPIPRIEKAKAISRSSADSFPLYVDVRSASRRGRYEPTGRIGTSTMVISFEDMIFTEFMPKWYDLVGRFDSACDLLFDRSQGFLTNRFFDTASALEAVHHRLKGSGSRATLEDRERANRVVQHIPEGDREWARSRIGQSFGPNFETR